MRELVAASIVAIGFFASATSASAQSTAGWFLDSYWSAEHSCKANGSDCVVDHTLIVPQGYAKADIFMTSYYLKASAAQDLKRIKISVEVDGYGYDSGTQQQYLNWRATANLKGKDTTVDFEFGVGITVVLTDGTQTFMKVLNVEQTGTAATAITQQSTLENSIGDPAMPSGVFSGFYIKSFEIESTGLGLVTPKQLLIDASQYTTRYADPKQPTDVNWSCGLIGTPNAAPVRCKMSLLGVAHEGWATAQAFDRVFTTNGGDQDVTLDPSAAGWYVGLQKTSAGYADHTSRPLQEVSGGCLRQSIGTYYTWNALLNNGQAVDSEVRCKEVQLIP